VPETVEKAAPPVRRPIVVERIGLEREPFMGDIYHFVLTTSWWRFFAMMAFTYAIANSVFAMLYIVVPGCIQGARPGHFGDAFFFSVQTMATIGYGGMVPVTTYANVLVTCESLLGVFGLALVTGLTFAKFARPTARVLFSNVAVVSKRDGTRSLMLRMANRRVSNIVDVNLFMVLAISDITLEGEAVRRFHTLELARSRAATFALSWTAIHAITPSSPLFGLDAEALASRRAEIILTLTGIDETFAQTVHARMNYTWEAVLFGHRFADIVSDLPDGRRQMNYRKFHETIPMELG
jgi:inward rectifier potassium channel